MRSIDLHIEPSAWNAIMQSTGGACSAALDQGAQFVIKASEF